MQLHTAPTDVAEPRLGSASGEKFARFRQFALSNSRRVLQNVYAAVLIIEKEQPVMELGWLTLTGKASQTAFASMAERIMAPWFAHAITVTTIEVRWASEVTAEKSRARGSRTCVVKCTQVAECRAAVGGGGEAKVRSEPESVRE